MADLTPEQEAEEFEFRARAEEEAKARQTAANNTSANPAVAEDPSLLTKAVGAGQVAYNLASEHPVAAGLAATGAASALSKVPYVGPAIQKMAGAVVPTSIKTIAGAIPNAMSNWAGSIAGADAQTLQKLQSTALQYSKQNLPVPQDVANGIQNLSQKLYPQSAGPVAPTAAPVGPAAGPVNPMAAEQGLASRVKQTAAQRITGLMPSMGEALGAAGRMAGRVMGPASLALQTTDLGPQTPQVGRMRGSEINPMSGKPWTPTEIRAYSANPGMYDQAYLQRPQLPR
jgi:hypothetical protein